MPIKAVLFDFMGTCLDWHTSITSSLPQTIRGPERSQFALDWRQNYFDANSARLAQGLPPEDIDITFARTLEEILQQERYADLRAHFSPVSKERCIAAWHKQSAWPEVRSAIEILKLQGLEVFVHANGTTRLQLDLARFSGLEFDMMLSSQLLGVYKPAPENYMRALALIGREPDECVTVAAHEYDLKGARAVGMKTVYVYRWTDDVNEDQHQIERDNDCYLLDMKRLDRVIAQL